MMTFEQVLIRLHEADEKVDRLGSQLGNGVVAVQNGESEEVILGMLRGELRYDHNGIVPTRESSGNAGSPLPAGTAIP